jgi:hypothetical protein
MVFKSTDPILFVPKVKAVQILSSITSRRGTNISAQGNALGYEEGSPLSLERAALFAERHHVVSPLQGQDCLFYLLPGRCPGLILFMAFQAGNLMSTSHETISTGAFSTGLARDQKTIECFTKDLGFVLFRNESAVGPKCL